VVKALNAYRQLVDNGDLEVEALLYVLFERVLGLQSRSRHKEDIQLRE